MTRFAAVIASFLLSMSAAASDISYEDRQAVLDLLSTHSWGLDTYDTPLLLSLFTADAVSRRYMAGEPVAEAQTSEERAADYNGRDVFKNQGIQTRHYNSNILMELDESGDIRVRSMTSVTYQYPGETEPRLVHTGRYELTATKTLSGWRFSRLELYFDHK